MIKLFERKIKEAAVPSVKLQNVINKGNTTDVLNAIKTNVQALYDQNVMSQKDYNNLIYDIEEQMRNNEKYGYYDEYLINQFAGWCEENNIDIDI